MCVLCDVECIMRWNRCMMCDCCRGDSFMVTHTHVTLFNERGPWARKHIHAESIIYTRASEGKYIVYKLSAFSSARCLLDCVLRYMHADFQNRRTHALVAYCMRSAQSFGMRHISTSVCGDVARRMRYSGWSKTTTANAHLHKHLSHLDIERPRTAIASK